MQNYITQDSINGGELKPKINPAASGSELFFTYDKMFLLKTIREKELHFLRTTVLEKYVAHLETSKNSFLAQYVGVYSYKHNRILVMVNLLQGDMNEVYDMKGSIVGRKVG